jgi:hypothetical protein
VYARLSSLGKSYMRSRDNDDMEQHKNYLLDACVCVSVCLPSLVSKDVTAA